MSKNCKFKLTNKLLIFLFIFIAVTIFVPAYAQETTVSNGAQLTVEDFSASFDNGKIHASALVKNVTPNNLEFIGRLSVESIPQIMIRDKIGFLGSSELFWTQNLGNFILLQPGEAKNINFDFYLSNRFKPGKYNVSLKLVSQLNDLLGTAIQSIPISGNGNFIEIQGATCVLIRDNQSFNPQTGPIFNPDTSPSAECTFRNESDSAISAKIRFTTNVFNVFAYYFSQPTSSTGEIITLSPHQEKKITFNLPKESIPQVYESAVQLVDDANSDNILSNFIPFRWTIKGASARISSVALDKHSYSYGEEALLNVGYYGSPDLFWSDPNYVVATSSREKGTDLNSLTMVVKLQDESGNQCGSASSNLPPVTGASLEKTNIKVPISSLSGCQNPRIFIDILNNNQPLVSLKPQTVPISPGVSKFSFSNIKIISVIIIILALLIFYFIYVKKI